MYHVLYILDIYCMMSCTRLFFPFTVSFQRCTSFRNSIFRKVLSWNSGWQHPDKTNSYLLVPDIRFHQTELKTPTPLNAKHSRYWRDFDEVGHEKMTISCHCACTICVKYVYNYVYHSKGSRNCHDCKKFLSSFFFLS